MAFFGLKSQIEMRKELDAELLERSYAELAASVSGMRDAPSFRPDDLELVDGAVRTCLRRCGVTPGTAPESLTDLEARMEWLCRPSGTMHRNVRLEGAWYRDAFGVMMARLDTGEPIALLPRTSGGYFYHDPATGKRRKVDASVAAHIEPDAVYFYRAFPQEKLSVNSLFLYIARVLDRSDYFFVLAVAAISTLVGLLPAWANNIAFGTVVPSGQADLIAPIGMLLLGVALSSALFGISRNLVMNRVSTKLQTAIEAATFSRILLLPTSFFKEYASGNLASRVTQVATLANLFTSLVLGSGLTSVLSLVYIAQIAVYAPVLAVPALVVAVLQALLSVLVTVISARRQRQAMQSSTKLSGLVTALLGGIQKIKLAGAEDRAFAKWAHQYAEYARATYNRPMLERALPAYIAFIGTLGSIAIYYLAGTGEVSMADYMAFSVAFGQVTGALMALSSTVGQIAQIGPTLDVVRPILESLPEVGEDKPSVERLSGAISVSGVTFRYDDKSPYVLKDLSFDVRPGEYVALVGKSGCGKSTIVRLLLGFEKPERGSIFYGRYDASKVDLRSLRQSIGSVMQDGRLFLGDIMSNITIAAPGATLDDAWRAAEIAGIADDIRQMPMGMQTILSEGSGGISGGQRQRLMIARAVCGERRILMLDEATSALDNITQKHVADSLEQLKCTRLVVAHRLSTVRHCDRILVVSDGHIAEEGTYDELIERDGLFADLVRRQRLE
jgi:NHLM bacteriocin system ABC transporter ATP-binding protein